MSIMSLCVPWSLNYPTRPDESIPIEILKFAGILVFIHNLFATIAQFRPSLWKMDHVFHKAVGTEPKVRFP